MDSEAAILSAMADCHSRIDAAEDAVREGRRKLTDLEDFASRFIRRNESIMADLDQRRYRLRGVSLDPVTANCMSTYKTSMQGLLDEGWRYTDRFVQQRASVQAAIDQIENDITHQRQVISRERDELVELGYRLRAARAASMAGV